MSPIAVPLDRQAADIARLTARLGRGVDVASLRITDRQGLLDLDPPTTSSPNRACRLIQAADGWIAINLARDEDRELVPAWLRCEIDGDPWEALTRLGRVRTRADLIADAAMLGLPAGRVGEVVWDSLKAPIIALGVTAKAERAGPARVIDLSALWAGPACGAVLAEMGAEVVKVESVRRPDPTRTSTPVFFHRLNGRKSLVSLDLAHPDGQAKLRRMIDAADVLITSARPRAFLSLGLSPDAVFAANPSLVWVAITGYGWTGEGASRVAFGDDSAAAGGLVRWTPGGAPHFLGDALADPVTGLAAAVGALEGLIAGGGVLVDAAMARCAAGAAHALGLGGVT